jgi:hypothetical protein
MQDRPNDLQQALDRVRALDAETRALRATVRALVSVLDFTLRRVGANMETALRDAAVVYATADDHAVADLLRDEATVFSDRAAREFGETGE